jgi:hypothetical protein
MRVRAPRDFAAGLLFVALGAAALVIGADYRPGTALNMGPGYFPRIVGGCLAGLGLLVVLGSLRGQGPALERWHLRPLLLVLGAVLAFGWLLERFGLVAAVAALASVSALAQEDRRPWEVPALIGALSLIAWLVFVRGLDLPIPLWPGSGGA